MRYFLRFSGFWGRWNATKTTTRIDEKRVEDEYLLRPEQLKGLPFQTKQRSPFSGVKKPLVTYNKADVEQRAKEVCVLITPCLSL